MCSPVYHQESSEKYYKLVIDHCEIKVRCIVFHVSVLGHLAVVDRDHTLSVLEEWIQDENMWLKRCAILYQLKYKKNTDQKKLFRFASD